MNDNKVDQWAGCIRWAGLFPTRSKALCRPAHQECQFRKPAPAQPRTAAPFGPAAPKMDDCSPFFTVPSDAIEPIFLRLTLHDVVISQYVLNCGMIRGFTDDTAGATRPVLSRKLRLPVTLRRPFPVSALPRRTPTDRNRRGGESLVTNTCPILWFERHAAVKIPLTHSDVTVVITITGIPRSAGCRGTGSFSVVGLHRSERIGG